MSEESTPPFTVDPRYLESLKTEIKERNWSIEGRNTKKPIVWTGAMIALAFLGGGIYVLPAIFIAWRMFLQAEAWGERGVAVERASIMERLMVHPTAIIIDRSKKDKPA